MNDLSDNLESKVKLFAHDTSMFSVFVTLSILHKS